MAKSRIFNLRVVFWATILFSLFFVACTKENPVELELSSESFGEPTVLPDDTTQLFVQKSNTFLTDTVILYLQGGPLDKLDLTYFNGFELSRFTESYVHQSSTYNPKFTNRATYSRITLDQAKAEVNQSVQMIYRAIDYYKKRGKKVFVFSHSFGSFILASLLEKYPNILAKVEKMLITAGRFDIDEAVWKGIQGGEDYKFDVLGLNPVSIGKLPKDVESLAMLQVAIGSIKYTQTLDMTIDLHKVIYAYGEYDAAVGRLNQGEIDFLNMHHADVYKIDKGHHGSMLESPHKSVLVSRLLGTP